MLYIVPQTTIDEISALLSQQQDEVENEQARLVEQQERTKQANVTQKPNYLKNRPPEYTLRKGLSNKKIIHAINEHWMSEETKNILLPLWTETYIPGVTDGSDIDIKLARALSLWCDNDPERIYNVMIKSPWATTRQPYWEANEPFNQINTVCKSSLKKSDVAYDKSQTNNTNTLGDSPVEENKALTNNTESVDEKDDKPDDEQLAQVEIKGDFDDLYSPIVKRNWLVKGLIVKGDIFFIYGESNLGKSFIGLDLGLRISLGLPVFNHFKVVEKRPVIYIGPEFDRQELFLRVKAACDLYDLSEDEKPMFLYDLQSFNLSDDRAVEVFIKYYAEELAKRGWENPFIIFDPYIMFLDESDSTSDTAAGQANEALRKMNRELNATSLFIAHPTKANSSGTRNNLKGSNYHYALAHGGLELREENKKLFLQKSKGRVFGDIDKIEVSLEEISMGEDEDGDDVTTCRVIYDGTNDFSTLKSNIENTTKATNYLDKMDKFEIILEFAQQDTEFTAKDVYNFCPNFDEETYRNALSGKIFDDNLSRQLNKVNRRPAKFRIKQDKKTSRI